MTELGADVKGQTRPVLLFNDECAVCRRLASWVRKSAGAGAPAGPSVFEQPIGDDPDALRAMNPTLDIWDAYETIHLLMPDGSMRLGGEAVAEVLRRLPNCRWFAWAFSIRVLGFRPFQLMLNLGYAILSDARPLLGCESCGIPSLWVKVLRALFGKGRAKAGEGGHTIAGPHFTALPARSPKPGPVAKALPVSIT